MTDSSSTSSRRPWTPSDYATVVIALCAVLVTGFKAWSWLRPAPAAQPTFREVDQTDRDRMLDGTSWIGSKTAPVQVAVFSDYQCPFCRETDGQIRRLVAAHPGQVAFVVRHLPLTEIHPQAELAAVAAECANDQGGFVPYDSTLFARQPELRAADSTWFTDVASAQGLDAHRFRVCLSSSEPLERVRRSVALALELRLTGTPATLLGNTLVPGLMRDEELGAIVAKLVEEGVAGGN